jgi:hypothetical protein
MKASLEQLDEYLIHFSQVSSFYLMALAERDRLHRAELRKPHRLSFWLLVVSVVISLLSLLGQWKDILSFFCALGW